MNRAVHGGDFLLVMRGKAIPVRDLEDMAQKLAHAHAEGFPKAEAYSVHDVKGQGRRPLTDDEVAGVVARAVELVQEAKFTT